MLSYFYPRPPYGGRPPRGVHCPLSIVISIHVPRMGDDRGRNWWFVVYPISIHVPRMGDDLF